MLTIDGGLGEGGGQILRTSLALSLWTGRPFRLINIRPRRRKPGLQRQHLAAVRAAAELGRARVEGDTLNSMSLQFVPEQRPRGGHYRFDIGTAGSTTLVLQTVLPALMVADGASTVTIEGGTHNPFAPCYEFIEQVVLPVIGRMGPRFECHLDRAGFYPRGGGMIRVIIEPTSELRTITLVERGRLLDIQAMAMLSHLPEHIAARELKVIASGLALSPDQLHTVDAIDTAGPGNAVLIRVRSEHLTELFSAIGERGVRAERVASRALQEARHYLATPVPVGRYLADQLLLPFALAGGGSFLTLPPSRHTRTNIEILRGFVDLPIQCNCVDDDAWRISVGDVA
jgi:RNA 3'-terminal phosphate cyclase (ATP)